MKAGSTDVTRYVKLVDSAAGTPESDYTITDLDLTYVRTRAAAVKADATALTTISDAHADNKAYQVSKTTALGLYRVDWPDAAFAAGVSDVQLVVMGSGLDPAIEEIRLTTDDEDTISAKIDSDALLADADHDKTQSDVAALSTKVDSDAVLEAADHDKTQSDVGDLSTKLASDVLALETALDSDFLAIETKVDSDMVLEIADHDKTQSDIGDLSTKVDSDAVLADADHDKSQSDIGDLSTKLGSDVLALEGALDSDFLAVETKLNSDALLEAADHDKTQSDVTALSTKVDSDAVLEVADHDKTQSDIAAIGLTGQDIAQIVHGRKTYYVDSTRADNTGDGTTWDTAKKTIAAATALMTHGNRIEIALGTYDESLDLHELSGVEAVGLGTVSIIGGGLLAVSIGSGGILRNLWFQECEDEGLYLYASSDDTEFYDCTFIGAKWGAVPLTSNRVYFERCKIRGKQASLQLSGGATDTVRANGCTLHTSGLASGDAHGVEAAQGIYALRDCEIYATSNVDNAANFVAGASQASANGTLVLIDCTINVAATGDTVAAGLRVTAGTIYMRGGRIETSGTTAYHVQQTGAGVIVLDGVEYDKSNVSAEDATCVIDLGEKAVDDGLDNALGTPTSGSVAALVKAIDTLTKASGDGDLAALLLRLTAARAGYLDELKSTNMPADIDTLKAGVALTEAERAIIAALILADPTYPIVTTADGYVMVVEPSGLEPSYAFAGPPYCEDTHIQDIFGTQNVEKWADLNNLEDADEIADRIDRAIAAAGDYIDDWMRGSPYKVPLEDPDGNVPDSVVDLAARYAGVWLYECRGIENFDPGTGKPLHRLAGVKASVRRDLEDIRSGRRRLDAV